MAYEIGLGKTPVLASQAIRLSTGLWLSTEKQSARARVATHPCRMAESSSGEPVADSVYASEPLTSGASPKVSRISTR